MNTHHEFFKYFPPRQFSQHPNPNTRTFCKVLETETSILSIVNKGKYTRNLFGEKNSIKVTRTDGNDQVTENKILFSGHQLWRNSSVILIIFSICIFISTLSFFGILSTHSNIFPAYILSRTDQSPGILSKEGTRKLFTRAFGAFYACFFVCLLFFSFLLSNNIQTTSTTNIIALTVFLVFVVVGIVRIIILDYNEKTKVNTTTTDSTKVSSTTDSTSSTSSTSSTLVGIRWGLGVILFLPILVKISGILFKKKKESENPEDEKTRVSKYFFLSILFLVLSGVYFILQLVEFNSIKNSIPKDSSCFYDIYPAPDPAPDPRSSPNITIITKNNYDTTFSSPSCSFFLQNRSSYVWKLSVSIFWLVLCGSWWLILGFFYLSKLFLNLSQNPLQHIPNLHVQITRNPLYSGCPTPGDKLSLPKIQDGISHCMQESATDGGVIHNIIDVTKTSVNDETTPWLSNITEEMNSRLPIQPFVGFFTIPYQPKFNNVVENNLQLYEDWNDYSDILNENPATRDNKIPADHAGTNPYRNRDNALLMNNYFDVVAPTQPNDFIWPNAEPLPRTTPCSRDETLQNLYFLKNGSIKSTREDVRNAFLPAYRKFTGRYVVHPPPERKLSTFHGYNLPGGNDHVITDDQKTLDWGQVVRRWIPMFVFELGIFLVIIVHLGYAIRMRRFFGIMQEKIKESQQKPSSSSDNLTVFSEAVDSIFYLNGALTTMIVIDCLVVLYWLFKVSYSMTAFFSIFQSRWYLVFIPLVTLTLVLLLIISFTADITKY